MEPDKVPVQRLLPFLRRDMCSLMLAYGRLTQVSYFSAALPRFKPHKHLNPKPWTSTPQSHKPDCPSPNIKGPYPSDIECCIFRRFLMECLIAMGAAFNVTGGDYILNPKPRALRPTPYVPGPKPSTICTERFTLTPSIVHNLSPNPDA